MTRVASRTIVTAQLGKITAPAAPVETPRLRMAIELASPVQDRLRDFILENRHTMPLQVIQPNTHTGRTLAICGAGPSLAQASIDGVNDVWACNSALPWLVSRGVSVTAGVGVDQTAGLIREWDTPPDVPYYVASSCDPQLIAHLQQHDRSVTFFHNHVGCDLNEHKLYCETWPPTYMVGQGFSVVSRVIGLAQWMGYERIDVYGADCAFGPNDQAHANGEGAADAYRQPLILEGEVNGRTYRTRPDMLMDAVHLVRRVREAQGRIRLMGDTLPVALLGKPDGYLDEVCRRVQPSELPTASPTEPPHSDSTLPLANAVSASGA